MTGTDVTSEVKYDHLYFTRNGKNYAFRVGMFPENIFPLDRITYGLQVKEILLNTSTGRVDIIYNYHKWKTTFIIQDELDLVTIKGY